MEKIPIKKQWDSEKGVWLGDKAEGDHENFQIPDPLWIFGYGSLCYKNGELDSDEIIDCKVKGYIRRFWQKSMDHRGTPQTPGYVCTLISESEIKQLKEKNEFEPDYLTKNEQQQNIYEVYGRAFKIKKESVQQVLDTLDFREKGGYSRDLVQIQHNGQTINALLYKGTIDNPAFEHDPIKRNTIEEQANIIQKTVGPSGPNIQYFDNLYQYLQKINALDKYMVELNNQIKKIQNQNK